ncbi:MAG: YbaY family lipoprotein [Vibrio sp.]
MKKIISLASLVGLSMLLTACGQEEAKMDQSQEQTVPAAQTTDATNLKAEYKVAYITGTVGYRERIAMPDNAVITVTLNDVSKADVVQEPIYTQNIQLDGKQVPAEFKLRYDANLIRDKGLYTVNAALKVDDKTIFRTDTPTFVITDENKTTSANLMMKRVPQAN